MQSVVMEDAFTEQSVYGVMATPAMENKSGEPGTTVTYMLQVTNTGNATDVYTLTVSGNAWTATVLGSVGPLAAGGDASVEVVMDISEDVVDGFIVVPPVAGG